MPTEEPPVEPDDTQPIPEPRFAIFATTQGDVAWSLRDYEKRVDYPFLTKRGAVGGMKLRVDGENLEDFDLIGSPIQVDAYGFFRATNVEFFK